MGLGLSPKTWAGLDGWRGERLGAQKGHRGRSPRRKVWEWREQQEVIFFLEEPSAVDKQIASNSKHLSCWMHRAPHGR